VPQALSSYPRQTASKSSDSQSGETRPSQRAPCHAFLMLVSGELHPSRHGGSLVSQRFFARRVPVRCWATFGRLTTNSRSLSNGVLTRSLPRIRVMKPFVELRRSASLARCAYGKRMPPTRFSGQDTRSTATTDSHFRKGKPQQFKLARGRHGYAIVLLVIAVLHRHRLLQLDGCGTQGVGQLSKGMSHVFSSPE
jgi:hypothetical protein